MWLDLVLGIAALVAAAPYVIGPVLIRFTHRMPARPAFEPYDPIRHPLPDYLAIPFGHSVDALTAEGFRLVADLAHESAMSSSQLRGALLEDPSGPTGRTFALVAAARSTNTKAKIGTCYVEYPAKFADDSTLSVSNNNEPYIYHPIPGRRIARFPEVRDPARLRRVHAALLERDYPGRALSTVDVATDPAGLLRDVMVREYEYQVGAGYLWLDPSIGAYRPTWRGAWAMTWKLLPPMRQIAEARRRRRAAALLAELGVGDRDARPIPAVASVDPVRWNFAILVAVAVLYAFGPGRGERRLRMPSDFTVPADFPGAVRALERLAGDSAVPLVGRNAADDDVPTLGVSVALRRSRADAFLAAAREPFFEQGFLLLIAERGFGSRRDRVALYPGRDPYAVMRVLGTNGANHDVTTDSIVAWLRALDSEQRFVVTGIGFDWVEGRFSEPVRDAAALARRCYAFCPDIVDHGVGTVSDLARELRRTRTLYCWWD